MSERQMIESARGDLRIQFVWPDASANERFGPAYGELGIWLRGTRIWGDGDGIVGDWTELLEYLGNYWLYLVIEQGYPCDASPDRPSLLDDGLDDRWRRLSDARIAEEEQTAYAFKMSHNLAEASSGTLRPDLWFVRDGGLFTVEARSAAESIVERLPDHDVKQALTCVGETIAKRLARATDPRSATAVDRWTRRDEAPFEVLAKLASGRTEEYLSQTSGTEALEAVFADPDSSWIGDNAYLDLLYRCKGEMPPAAMRVLIERVRAAPAGRSSRLDDLAEGALAELANVENILRRPFQQGHALANWLRPQVAAAGGRVDSEPLLGECGVAVGGHDLSTPRLDAVAFWAHGRQPAVLWNTSEKHQANEGARRATLAHEICHLLVDRQDALPLAAVVGGAMERRLEQRANAFAAELLCPRQAAGAEYRRVQDVGAALNNLTRCFGVSTELASLQLARSGAVSEVDHQRQVEQSGPPGAFYPWDRRCP